MGIAVPREVESDAEELLPPGPEVFVPWLVFDDVVLLDERDVVDGLEVFNRLGLVLESAVVKVLDVLLVAVAEGAAPSVLYAVAFPVPSCSTTNCEPPISNCCV